MENLLDKLFYEYKFEKVRNEVLEEFFKKIQGFNESDNNILNKYKEYLKKNGNKNIEIKGFQFNYNYSNVYLCPENNADCLLKITKIKVVNIHLKNTNLLQKEYICSEEYLKYIINNYHKIKNPTYKSKKEDDLNDEISDISLNNLNISEFMKSDYSEIYESDKSDFDFNKIKVMKDISISKIEEKVKDEFFINIVGINLININPETIYQDTDLKHSTIDDLMLNIENLETKTIIFHNDNDYLTLNIILNFERLYNGYNNFYLYINYEKLKLLSKIKRLEYFAYCLLSLFTKDYSSFNEFFENNIKDILTKDINQLPKILEIIINYLEKNILKNDIIDNGIIINNELKLLTNNLSKKFNLKNDITTELYKINSLFFKNLINYKSIGNTNEKIINKNNTINYKYYFIIDDINKQEDLDIIENIIQKNYFKNYLKFLVIIKLNNDFAYNIFFKLLSENIKIFFANFKDINKEDKYYIKGSKNYDKIFCDTNEEFRYDLLRIFNYETIYAENINYNINTNFFLKKYMKYLNIEFNNKLQKIEKIEFKTSDIKDILTAKYLDTLNYIKVRSTHKFDNFRKQNDYFELEKLIISIIISTKIEDNNFLELKVHSIFGFRGVIIKENINYNFKNFIIKQNSLGAEAFDFAIKLRINNKNYLKIYQITSFKSDEDLEKLCLEKLLIYISYIIEEFKKYNLGEIDGVIFGIITFTEIHDEPIYKKLKIFCKKNNYEFILFDINEASFKIRQNNSYIKYDKELFQFNNEYKLNIPKFKDIININNKELIMMSSRIVKNKKKEKENEEDKISQNIFNNNSGQNCKIKRVSKLKYKGMFKDIIELDKNYFIYAYDKNNKCYFYDKNLINCKNGEKCSLITIILYSIILPLENYEDSSSEAYNPIPKKRRKIKNNNENKNKTKTRKKNEKKNKIENKDVKSINSNKSKELEFNLENDKNNDIREFKDENKSTEKNLSNNKLLGKKRKKIGS